MQKHRFQSLSIVSRESLAEDSDWIMRMQSLASTTREFFGVLAISLALLVELLFLLFDNTLNSSRKSCERYIPHLKEEVLRSTFDKTGFQHLVSECKVAVGSAHAPFSKRLVQRVCSIVGWKSACPFPVPPYQEASKMPGLTSSIVGQWQSN